MTNVLGLPARRLPDPRIGGRRVKRLVPDPARALLRRPEVVAQELCGVM